jgi:putative ABC transport system permease protein
VLAGTASAFALATATAAVQLLVRASPIDIPRLAEVRVDWATITFVIAACAVVAAACAVPSALRAVRGGLAGLRDSSSGATTGRSRTGVRSALVAFQMALAVVALTASALLLKTVARLHALRPGFDANGVATLWVTAPVVRYPKASDVDRFHSTLLARLRALPGVSDAGISTSLPLAPFGHNGDPLYVEGKRDLSKKIPPLQFYAAADAGFFHAMRIPLVAGRTFGALETQRWDEAVVSRETAQRMFGDSTGATVIGKRFQILPQGPPYTVIGVIGSVRDTSLMMPPAMTVYVAPVASGDTVEGQDTRTVAVVARTSGDIAATTRAMRRIVHDIDPTLPAFDVKPMADILRASMARQTFVFAVLSIAAGITVLLGVVGLYGVIAFTVSLRRKELGLRIALGATPGEVALMVARRGVMLSVAGTAVGAVVAVLAARFLRSFLFEVTPFDPVALGGAAVTLIACAVAASWLPATTAAGLDPADVLRSE